MSYIKQVAFLSGLPPRTGKVQGISGVILFLHKDDETHTIYGFHDALFVSNSFLRCSDSEGLKLLRPEIAGTCDNYRFLLSPIK